MSIIETLKKYNQEHLINVIDKMDEERKENILSDLEKIDFNEITNLTKSLLNKKKEEFLIEPMEYTDKSKLSEQEIKKYQEKGIELIKNNKYAVITMAGGQGSRLGHSGPKGTYMLNINGEEKSIFEILSTNLKIIKDTYNVDIPWYIMTSSTNNNETEKFFKDNDNFGLNLVKFFKQGDIPVINKEGKLVVGEDYLIKKAGNGNGGIYKSLYDNGILKEIEDNGIEWIFISGVDNILMKLADPLFIGLNYYEGTEIASKSSIKIDPNEKTGAFCKRNGVCSVLEYSEISDEMKQLRDLDGNLVYGQINIVAHLYSINALKKLKDVDLRYHIAHKKISYLDENLNLIKPEEPNMYKFEKFIFDGFEQFENMTLLNVKREDEFAPIKNAKGKDSPETAIELYLKTKRI